MDVSLSEDGTKRIITKTGVFSGTELHLWAVAPHHDERLPLRPGRPELTFDARRRQVATTEEWKQARLLRGREGRGRAAGRREGDVARSEQSQDGLERPRRDSGTWTRRAKPRMAHT
jgi:hypothetical protein